MTEEFALFGIFSGILLGITGLFLTWKKHDEELKNKRKKIRVDSNRRL